MRSINLQAYCTPEEAKRRFYRRYLSRQHYDRLIAESSVGVLDGERKFVFLRNVLAAEGVKRAGRRLARLKFANVQESRRLNTYLHATAGEDAVLGFLFSPYSRRTRRTDRYAATYYRVIVPLGWSLQELMEQYWPEAAKMQAEMAKANGRMLIGAELPNFFGVAVPLQFSSITINHNLVIPCHHDKRNVGPSI